MQGFLELELRLLVNNVVFKIWKEMVKNDSIYSRQKWKCDKKSIFSSLLIIIKKPKTILFGIHAKGYEKERETLKKFRNKIKIKDRQ